MKDWNRKQAERQKARALGKLPKEGSKVAAQAPNYDISKYPVGYRPGDWVSIEEAQAIERYSLMYGRTGDSTGGWVNKNGSPVAFSY